MLYHWHLSIGEFVRFEKQTRPDRGPSAAKFSCDIKGHPLAVFLKLHGCVSRLRGPSFGMQEPFSLLVKFYSTYSESIPAPSGFATPNQPLDPNKWEHFPAECTIRLRIGLESDNVCNIHVAWEDKTLDTIKISLLDNIRAIQFTARSPSISCKYLIWRASAPFVKRFQITLNSSDDFERLYSVLSALRLFIKPARPIMPQSLAFPSGTDHSTTTPQKASQGTSAAKENNKSSFLKNSLLEKKYLMQLNEFEPDYLINSQVATDSLLQTLPTQAQERVRIQELPNWNEFYTPTTMASVGIPSSKAINSFIAGNQYQETLRTIGQEPERYQAARRSPTKMILNREPETISDDVQLAKSQEKALNLSDQSQPVAQLQFLDGHAISQSQTLITQDTATLMREPIDNMIGESPRLNLPPSTKEIKATMELQCGKRGQINVLDCSNNIREDKNHGSGKRLIEANDKNKEQHTAKKATKVRSADSQKAPSSSKVRVSRRQIKEKLKDECFMKWVFKVEEILKEMSSEQVHNG